MKIAVLLLTVLAGCAQVDKYHVLAAKIADDIYAGAIRTLCHAPPDVQIRAISRGDISGRGLIEMCDEYKTLSKIMLGETFNNLEQ